MKKEVVPGILSGALLLGLAAAPATPAYAADATGADAAATITSGDASNTDVGAQAPVNFVEVEITTDDMPESVADGQTDNSALKKAVERLNLSNYDSITALKVTTAEDAFLRPEDNMWLKTAFTNVSYLDESECACSIRKLTDVYLTYDVNGNRNAGYLEDTYYREFGGLANFTTLETLLIPKDAQVINTYWYSGVEPLKRGGGINGCTSLTDFSLPDGLVLLENGSCSGLTSYTKDINIPDTVVIIGNNSFGGVSRLKCGELHLGSAVKVLNKNAFSGRLFKGDFNVPDSVRRIDVGALEPGSFEGGTWSFGSGMKYFGVLKNICSGNTGVLQIPEAWSIDAETFSGNTFSSVVFEGNRTFIPNMIISGSTNVTKVVLPSTVTDLGHDDNEGAGACFYGCTSLSEINLPDTLRFVSKRTFQGCSSLKSAVLPSSVTYLGESAYEKSGLVGAFVPSSIETIGVRAFRDIAQDSVVYAQDAEAYGKLVQYDGGDPDGNNPIYSKSKTALAVTNGGTFTADTQFVAGELKEPSREGYTFAGWYKDANFETPAEKEESGAYKAEPGKTYYAKFVTRISFDANGGQGTMNAQDVTDGDSNATLATNAFTKTGYTFTGWNMKADGTGIPYAAGTSVSDIANGTTLYAQWKANSYTVAFDANGGSGSMESVAATYDTPVLLDKCGFTSSDSSKKFAGWAKSKDDANSGKVDYSLGSQVSNLTSVADYTVTLYAVWTDKEVWSTPKYDNVVSDYDGKPHGYPLDDGYTVWYEPEDKLVDGYPVHAGTYDVVITRDADDDHAAFREERDGGIVINKSKLTIKADDKSCYVGSELPEPSFTVTGWQGEDAAKADELLKDAGIKVAYANADANTAGIYGVTITSDATELDDYEIELVQGTLTVSNRPVTPPSTTTTETVTNPDGSVTTTETDKSTGTVTVTTKATDGVVTKTVTAKGAEPKVSVTVPASVKSATVTVPVEPSEGTVVVDAKTGRVVNRCVATEGGLDVRVDGSCELVVRDNAREFGDMNGHWSEKAVDFASARGLMNGIGGTGAFEPETMTSRAMVCAVLSNLEYSPEATKGLTFADTDADGWYAKAVAWAAETGIVHGYGDGKTFGPGDDVTREQMACMIFNYAKAMGMDVSKRADLSAFGDAGDLTYGREAMEWCVASGIFHGYEGQNELGATDGLTRGQCAAVLMNLVTLIVEG